jgi:tetratricopeptide (TPR) repeat protein
VFFAYPRVPQNVSISSALAELNEGRILEAIEKFKEIIRSDPANGTAYFYLATLYTEMGEYELAERYLERSMEVNTRQDGHYYQFGVIRSKQKQWQPALAFFEQALQLGAGAYEAAAWRGIGDAQVELFDRDAAFKAYENALRVQPNDARTRLSIGRLYLERSQTKDAITNLRSALAADPSLPATHALLGRAYRQAGDLQAAVAILTRALELNPADQDSRYTLGQVLLAMGRNAEGRAQIDTYESVRQQVVRADSDYQAGLSRLEAGNLPEAESLLREAVRRAPSYGHALHALGMLLLDRGSADTALDFLKRAAEVNPLNAPNWFGLGTAYFKTGRTEEARFAARRAVVLNEDEPRFQRLLADIEGKGKN